MMFAVFTVFAAVSAFGQDLQPAGFDTGVSITGGVLKRTGFSKLAIGEQTFSFRNINSRIEDSYITDRLKKGFNLEKTAIGIGALGTVTMGIGLMFYIGSDWGRGLFSGVAYFMMPIAGVVGIVSIVLGVTGSVIIKKTIEGYNNSSQLRLGLAPTPGGLGLQLTF